MSHDSNATISSKFSVGDVVSHKFFGFRGVIFDVVPDWKADDLEVSNYTALRYFSNASAKGTYYRVYAERDEHEFIAFVSEDFLKECTLGTKVRHSAIYGEFFDTPSNVGKSTSLH